MHGRSRGRRERAGDRAQLAGRDAGDARRALRRILRDERAQLVDARAVRAQRRVVGQARGEDLVDQRRKYVSLSGLIQVTSPVPASGFSMRRGFT